VIDGYIYRLEDRVETPKVFLFDANSTIRACTSICSTTTLPCASRRERQPRAVMLSMFRETFGVAEARVCCWMSLRCAFGLQPAPAS